MTNKRTKIIATIGPVSDSPEMVTHLIESGVNIFRFNLKHNEIEWHKERIQLVREISKKLNMPIGVLIDLQGPELRVNMAGEAIELTEGESIVFGEEAFKDGAKGFSITHPDIIPHLKDGQDILVDDGRFSFEFKKTKEGAFLVSKTTGVLKKRKTLNIPGANFPFPVLIERDFDALKLAALGEVDYIALSFVREENDLKVLREEMEKHKITAKVISKIETQKALDDLEAIIKHSDGIMIARGDLGVELPFEQVPFFQKDIIRRCMERGIPVITATQMLESMTENPYPTRAEVSDVANAVYDFTDAVMLSGESASGKHPVKAVDTMRRTVKYIETNREEIDTRSRFHFDVTDQEQMLADTAYNLALKLADKGKDVGGFIVFSKTGRTVRMLSRYHANFPIYAFVPDRHTQERLTIQYSVVPFVHQALKEDKQVTSDEIQATTNQLVKDEVLKKGSTYILLHGDRWLEEGKTSTVKLITL